MSTYYTDERNAQILIALMKEHGIRKVIASPGTTNICLVASLQQDPFFQIFSSVDERSAAYMACGMAAESGEPVALSCTGATASRNYVPGLTEAFYRKLPVIAITSSQPNCRIGHNIAQVTDRRILSLADIVLLSVQLPIVKDREDEWECEMAVNRALLEVHRRGGGPVHINLQTKYSCDYSIRKLPVARAIHRYTIEDVLPDLPMGRIAVFVGAHLQWSERLTKAVDQFCQCYDAVVLCDQTSNYAGKYGVNSCLVEKQMQYRAACTMPDILIHIGDVSGVGASIRPKQVWRVNPDGELRDTFRKLTIIFEMSEELFFERYAERATVKRGELNYCREWHMEDEQLRTAIPDLPFSSAWIAQCTAPKLPEGSVLHLGIYNSLRTWNYFLIPNSVRAYSNVGGFGIDGSISALLGASLASPDKLFFGVVGDLAFFYDINSLGNRHVGKNIRLMLVNNGTGFEMKYYRSPAPVQSQFGDFANDYFAARGHFGKQSRDLVRHYAEDLGFQYMTASSKQEYSSLVDAFVQPKPTEKPIIFEVFTDENLENDAQKILDNLRISASGGAKSLAKNLLGSRNVQKIKDILNN